MTLWKTLRILALCVMTQVSCGQGPNYHNILMNAGYIPYKTPLAVGGTGTLYGGRADSLSIVAHPETCFPYMIDGEATNIRKIDQTNLPMVDSSFSITGNTIGDLKQFFDLKNDLNNVKTVEIKFTDVQVEYMDLIALTHFYNEGMSQICKNYLDSIGFIIQALRVNKLEVNFFNSSKELMNLKEAQFTSNSLNLSWHIDRRTTLVIDSPRYIGYQMGWFQKTDNGIALNRANKMSNGRYVFQNIKLFKTDKWLTPGSINPPMQDFYQTLNQVKSSPYLKESLLFYNDEDFIYNF